jgi:hypothetical protein
MRALLCIGCNAYDHLQRLDRAEKDAKDLFDLLVYQSGDYGKEYSRLLLSPTHAALTESLSQVLPTGKEIDVLTFFFAGHGAVKAGSFYLCARDTNPGRLSMTAFPIVSLFSIVNEFQPRQLNIVIDACQAGGSSFDVSQLLKPEVVGRAEASSITFLGACSADQIASETSQGGVLTRQILKCLTGERQIQTKSPSLDLIEISTDVCQQVHQSHLTQKPIAWGLSLFGNGYFARNPHFDSSAEPSFPVSAILPQSEIGKRIRLKSSAIWDEYRTIKEDPNPRRLLDMLESVFRGLTGDLPAKMTCVQGLARTLAAGAHESLELLAPSQSLAACAVFFLPEIDSDAVIRYTSASFREIMALDMPIWHDLLASLKAERPPLLSEIGVMADLYYLPFPTRTAAACVAAPPNSYMEAKPLRSADERRSSARIGPRTFDPGPESIRPDTAGRCHPTRDRSQVFPGLN